MKYTIQKIAIDKEATYILIGKMAAAVWNEEPMDLDKRPKEFCFPSDDGLIDIYLRVSFNSDYHRVDGGVECVGRGVEASVTMCDAETGLEILFDCPVSIEEMIRKTFEI